MAQEKRPAIHLIERHEVDVADIQQNLWHSGYWPFNEDMARRLVGANLYLHRGVNDPSHIGGPIVGFHVHPSGVEAGQIVLHFKPTVDHSGVMANPDGWGDDVNIST